MQLPAMSGSQVKDIFGQDKVSEFASKLNKMKVLQAIVLLIY